MAQPRANSGAILGGIPQNQFGEDIPAVGQADPRAQAAFDARRMADMLANRKMQEEAIAREKMAAMQEQQPALQSLLGGMTQLPRHLREMLQQGAVEGGRAMMVPDTRSVRDLQPEEYGPYFQRQLGQAGLQLDQEVLKSEGVVRRNEEFLKKIKEGDRQRMLRRYGER